MLSLYMRTRNPYNWWSLNHVTSRDELLSTMKIDRPTSHHT